MRAFTLVELLVVIVILGVLISVLLLVAGNIVDHQKASSTKMIMQTVESAIDQYAQLNPLRQIYDNPHARAQNGALIGRTFGPYPPYALENANNDNCLTSKLERGHVKNTDFNNQRPGSLAQRLRLDFNVGANALALRADDYMYAPGVLHASADDDIRALYIHLEHFVKGALSNLPSSAVAPLSPTVTELFNPTGANAADGQPGTMNVFGIHDAWGVPLDYYLVAKYEWKMPPSRVFGPEAAGDAAWMVTDIRPVLRSWGQSRDKVMAAEADPRAVIYSTNLPQPALRNTDPTTGVVPAGDSANNGWAWVLPDMPTTYRYGPNAMADTRAYTFVPAEEP